MRMLLVRIGPAIGTVLLVEQWPFPVLPGLWLLLIWLLPRVIKDRQETQRMRTVAGLMMLRVDTLETELASMQQLNNALQNQVRQLQERDTATGARQSQGTVGHPLYRRVGLDQDCPRWVAEAVRREYRKRLHPDTKPPNQKAEAEQRFKQMEEVFGEIWRLRTF